jgi:hypothetical protein
MAPDISDVVPGRPMFELALQRAKADFLEMPGLQLTMAQARRLWMLDSGICEAVLAELLGAQFLARSRNGSFVRADGSMPRV